MAFIEPCFGIGHNLSLICQMTSEDIKHQLIILFFSFFFFLLHLNHAKHACVFALTTLTAMKFCIGSGSVNKQYMTIFLFPWQLLCKMLTRRGLCVGCFRVSTAIFVFPWQLLCKMLTRRGLCVGCFRVRHCEKATELQAVETLLISDELFRYVCACAWVGACMCMHVCVCV